MSDKAVGFIREAEGSPPDDLYVLPRFKEAVDDAAENDAVLVLTIHALFDQPERLRDCLLYAYGEGVDVVFATRGEEAAS